CPVCNEVVTWTAKSGTSRFGAKTDGSHSHYYLTGDLKVTADSYLLKLTNSTKMCLHLNGHNITYDGYVQVTSSTLNIMGVGNVNFNGNAEQDDGWWKFGFYITSNGKLNLLGGVYNVTDVALESNCPMVYQSSGATTIKNAAVYATVELVNGGLTLDETASVSDIKVSANSKLTVKGTWTGSARVGFATAMVDGVVPTANGVAEGVFTGKLVNIAGTRLWGTEEGTLILDDPNKNLMFNENGEALCPYCNEMVTWTELTANKTFSDGKHHHYYLTKNLDVQVKTTNFIRTYNGSKLCLHLNGNNIVHGSRMFIQDGSTLAIMGNGNVTYTASVTSLPDSQVAGIRAAGNVALLGGTYGISGYAETNNIPYISKTANTLTISGATVNGTTSIEGGTVIANGGAVNGSFAISGGSITIDGEVTFQNLQVGTAGKLTVGKNWTGSAVVNFAAGLTDNQVPITNGVAEGVYTGSLTMPDGSTLEGFADGTIRKVVKLELDASGKGYCPACDETVTWTAYNGGARIASLNDGAKGHYYLPADVSMEGLNTSLALLRGGSSMCLHLNNHTLTSGSYAQVASDSTLNIMGTGNMIFTSSGLGNYHMYAIYCTGGSVNLYGGNYSVAGAAAENGISTIHQTSGAVTVYDVAVSGVTNIQSGTFTLAKTATLKEIIMSATAKLAVEENWTGLADVKLGVALVNGQVPAANGASTGSFIGGLVMTDGTILKGEDGKLVINDYKELLLNKDQQGYCMVCNKMAVWKPVHDGGNVGTVAENAHEHFYLADDNMTAKNAEFLYGKEGSLTCLHLNGKSVKVAARLRVYKCALNIMGDGHMELLGTTTNETYNSCLIYSWGTPYTPATVVKIYGGTYTSANGMPVVYGYGTYSSVMSKTYLYGDTHIDGVMTLDQAHVYLNDNATVESIEASNTGSVRVDESWAGTARVSYLADMFEEYVNIFNGRSTGDFIGGLIMDGKRLIGESGRLRIVSAQDLRVNEENQGYCAVCHEVVNWIAVSGSTLLGAYTDGNHRHMYLKGNVEAQTAENFLRLAEGSDLCLHLNGYDITYGSPIVVENGSVFNVWGEGNVAFTGTDAQSMGAIENAGTVNLLGGTYDVTETASTEKLVDSFLYLLDGKVTVKNATINSGNYLEKGTLTLDGTATLESMHIEATGFLSVADTWTGSAAVEFANGLTGKYAPASNVSMDKAVGKLTLQDGRVLQAGANGVFVSDSNAPNGLTYKLYNTYAEIISYAGDGVFLLPAQIEGKPVTEIANGAFRNFTGTLYIGQENAVGLAWAEQQGIAFTTIAAINGTAGYATVEEALNAFAGGVVQLLTDAGDITIAKDTYLDLNGFDVANATVTGGTLFVMDSQTDDFTVADGNYGKITGKITGSVKAVSADAACAEHGYFQVREADGVSFHCVAMDIHSVNLEADVAGVKYDASFAADEVVAPLIQSYGIALSAYGDPDETRKDWCYSEYTDFAAGENDKSVILSNVMKTELADVQNLARANTPIYGRAYIRTVDGYVFGQTICRDLQEQTELTDLGWETYTKDQRKETRAMYETYQSIIDEWDIYHLDKYVDRIWFTEPAPDTGAGWEQYSLPIGNGYLGTSIFGGTDEEVLSFSDKTMYNPGSSADEEDDLDIPADEDVMAGSSVGSNGFTNLCKLILDFGHDFSQVTDYQRDLLLDSAEARVNYTYKGVGYSRTYFANYPDNVTVAKLDASQKGKLSFTLRPTPTYIRDHLFLEGDGLGKTATVTASGDTAILAGTLSGYQINYEIQFKVIPVGGTMTANADGTITVTNADSAVILITAGTNYEMKPETMTAGNKDKLDPNSFPHEKVTAVMNAAAQKSYEELLQTHLEDYQEIYGRVQADLNSEPSTTIPTNKQMQAYRAGDHSAYVEELLFKHGRYLLIASSREGT
ncbi:MAG: glycoside hydrolase family 95 protein, partial [Oscillospiraceae bacterium]|nr:glycoside hydrolase family 95 protein [Oscillospiraceae bacterium]